MAAKPINLARASREELLDFIKDTGTTIQAEGMSDADVRSKAMEIQDGLADIGEAAEIEKKARQASKADRAMAAASTLEMLKGIQAAGVDEEEVKSIDLDSWEVQPHDGDASSIHKIVQGAIDSKLGDYNPTAEQREAEERAKVAERQRNMYAIAGADKEIAVWHAEAERRHGAKLTNVCFFLLKGMNLSSFNTGFTKIPGVRLQKNSPYRALDVELKILRRKRDMLGEMAYEGSDMAKMPTSAKATRGRPAKKK